MARDRSDDIDDIDDRPARRRDAGDLAPTGARGPLDGMFANTNIVILVLFGLCCALISLPLSAIGFFTAKDPKAKSNAQIVMIISGLLWVFSIVANFLGLLAGFAGGAR